MPKIEVRVSDEELAALQAKAKGAGLSLSAWVRERCLAPDKPLPAQPPPPRRVETSEGKVRVAVTDLIPSRAKAPSVPQDDR